MRRIAVSHTYETPQKVVWDINTHTDSSARLMKGLVTFKGMPPSVQIKKGDVFNVKVRLFGFLPDMDYRMELLECDHASYRFVASECGGAVKTWIHESKVETYGTGCVLTDTVDIDAGLMTIPTCWWGKWIYHHRHKPRLKMIAEHMAHLA